VHQFLYMLGNMVPVVGRDEPIPLSNGVVLVRDMCLVRLLLADIFIPRAKPLAERTGAVWPVRYERASVEYLERMTGARLADR
jgi:hypothetical protein